MKKLLAVMLSLVLVLGFAACSNWSVEVKEPEAESSSSSESSENEISDDEPDVELNQQDGTVLFYKYYRSGIYEAAEHFVPEGESKIRGIISFVAENIFPEELLSKIGLPKVNSVKIEKSYLTVDFAEELLDYGKDNLELFFNSLAMTVTKNAGLSPFGFSVDGDFEILGRSSWEPAPLKMSESTPEEFSAIRAEVPFSGLDESFYSDPSFVLPEMAENSLAEELSFVLQKVRGLHTDFENPQERDMKDSVFSLLMSVNSISTYPDDENYVEAVSPIAASVTQKLGFVETMFWLKEHIEEGARLLYGDDFVVEHQTVRHFDWYETEGVYAPPHMGGGYNYIPVITGCSEEENTVTAEFVYLYTDSSAGVWDETCEKFLSDYDGVSDYAANAKIRHSAVFTRESDGRLVLKSHHIVQ